jgi:hypothetical protein
MTKARKVTEVTVTTENTPGTLGKVTTTLSKAGINVENFCAYCMENKGYCTFVCTDTETATTTLKGAGFDVTTKDAVWVTTDQKVGTLCEISTQLGEAGINIDYCYGTTGNGNTDTSVFITDNNDKAVTTLGG